jgi:4-hydroxy-tetrahydrodipicolinate synthase
MNMKQVEIKGIIPPIITPMNEDESVNEEELRRQVNRQIEGGVHGLFPFGTNGEGYILSEKEKGQVLRIVVEETRGRVPVYAGTGCISTKDTIRQSQMAKEAGADILSIITPSFAAASQNELYEHYKSVAESVDMPIVLYNIPARTGNALAPATVGKLSKIENIVGAKDSSGNFDNMLQYIEQTRERGDFSVLSGNDSLILWNLLAGGTGGIAGCANVFPEVMASIYNYFVAGDLDNARKAQDSIRSFRACFKYGNPNTIVKTAVKLLGYPVGKCRAPFNQVPEEGVKAILQVLKEDEEKGMCRFV